MSHCQSIPYHWFLPIHNLQSCTSQRRVLSKRINSPSWNRYILNRDQLIQYKGINVRHTIHLQVCSGFECNRRHLIPRLICPIQERGPRISGWSPSTSGRSPLITLSWVYSPIKTSVIIQTMWRPVVFNHHLHRRHIVESVIQNGYKPGPVSYTHLTLPTKA